jgi:hypothetical protein
MRISGIISKLTYDELRIIRTVLIKKMIYSYHMIIKYELRIKF